MVATRFALQRNEAKRLTGLPRYIGTSQVSQPQDFQVHRWRGICLTHTIMSVFSKRRRLFLRRYCTAAFM